MSRSCSLVAALVVGAVAMTACSNDLSSDAPGRETFVITQADPILSDIELGPAGNSAGDLLVFEAVVTDPEGNSGQLLGMLTTVDLPEPGGSVLEGRLGQLVFSFGDDTLVAIGGTEYAEDQAEMVADQPQVRAVVGGTGRYLGARGDVVTERETDGTYTHTFTLLTDD